MAGAFPTLKSGNTVFYPLQDTHSFKTGVLRFMDDSEQRWKTGLVIRKFKLVCTDMNTYNTALILQFFRSQFGRFDGTWSLTIGAETISNLAFDSDVFQMVENKRNRTSLSFEIVQLKSSAPAIPTVGTYFPQINSNGILTSLPYNSQYEYKTTVSALESGNRYTYKWRTDPLGKYALNLVGITDVELDLVRNYFYGMEGKYKQFGLLDPGGNLVPRSDDFSNAAWVKSSITVGAAQTDPFGGNLATRLTSSATSGLIYTTILPGNASGFLLTVSAWARAVSAGQSLAIGFLDGSLANLGFITWPLLQGVWKRIYCTITLATNSSIIANIGGANTWGTGQAIDIFSAQCVPLPGPGPRLLTPGMDGLRAKCRFDTDDFVATRNGINDNSVTLPIAEYR